MKIIDTFLFFNEEKMLDYRLNYYKHTVDYFILIESNKTFSGLDKPLYFEKIKDKYTEYKDKLIHYIVNFDDLPTFLNKKENEITAWDREHYQRNCIKEAIKNIPNINDEDWIHLVDIDEFSNRDKLMTVKNSDYYSSKDKVGYTLEYDMYYYNVCCKHLTKWYHPKLIRYSIIKNNDLNAVRCSFNYFPLLIEFGWHFSYFFSPEKIIEKIKSFSHQEYNTEDYTDKNYIEECIKNNKSIFSLDKSRNDQIIYIPIEDNKNLPEDIHLLLN